MIFGSVASGIGTIDRGCELAGMVPAWQIEIDAQCRSVLARHWPNVKRYIDAYEVEHESLDPVDILVGGTPCQDLSVAGRRAGLAGEQSRLFYRFVGLADYLSPTWILWENVFGALSSPPGRKGEDFAIVLAELTGFHPAVPEGGWRNAGICVGPKRTAAWRVFDGQFFGVAQKRRRVFVVAHSRDRTAPAKILFEPESGEGDTPPGREAGARVAKSVAGSLRASGGYDHAGDESKLVTVGTLRASHNMNQVEDAANGHYIVHTLTSKGADASEDGTGRGIPIIAFDWQAGGSGDTSFRGKSRSYIVRKGEYAGSVQAAKHDAIQQGAMVRRLTVTECERLFALPDGYTAFGADGKPISDSARYRMLGNAAIVSVILWIARRIVREEEQCSKAT